MPVTVDAGARNSYYSAGNIGWSARCLYNLRLITSESFEAPHTSTTTVGSAATSQARGQSFTLGSSQTIDEVRLLIGFVGNPADYCYLEIQTDDGSSHPSGTVLATSLNTKTAYVNIASAPTWVPFYFTSFTLSASTKYWLVVKRSGSVDASNYFLTGYNNGSLYSGGGRAALSSGVWGAESATDDIPFEFLKSKSDVLYIVTQDTALHMWKSTDAGVSWTEIDSTHAPSVNNSVYPFSGTEGGCARYYMVVYFSGANTLSVRYFDFTTDLWTTAAFGTGTITAAASNQRNIRVTFASPSGVGATEIPRAVGVVYTSSTDDADINKSWTSSAAAAWTADVPVLAGTSTERSLLSDVWWEGPSSGNSQDVTYAVYYDCTNDDLSYRRQFFAGSLGSESDIDATAADVDTEHACATYESYESSSYVRTAIIAFIDSDGTLEEVIATAGAADPGLSLATQNQISSDTGAAGRQLSSCRFNGVNYVFACDGSNIDMHSSSVAGTWTNTLNKITGLTSGTLAQAIPVAGKGVILAYTDNGDVKVEWVVVLSVTASRTVTPVAHRVRTTSVRTFSVSHRVRKTVSRSITPAAHRIRKINTRTISPAAHRIRLTLSRTLTPMAHKVRTTLVRPITMSHRVRAIRSRAVPVAHRVRVTQARAITPVAHKIRTTLARSVPAAHRVRTTLNRTVTMAHRVVVSAVYSRAITPVAHRVRVVQVRTAPMAHRVRTTSTRAITPVAHKVRTTGQRAVAPLAHRVRAKSQRSVLAAHRVRVTSVRTFSVAHRLSAKLPRLVPMSHRVRSTLARAIPMSARVRVLLARSVPVAHRVVAHLTRSVTPVAHRIRKASIRSVTMAHQVNKGNERSFIMAHRIKAPTTRNIPTAHLVVVGGPGGNGIDDLGWQGEVWLVEQRRD